MIKCTTVKLTFKSEKTFKQVYDIQIKDVKDAVRMVGTDNSNVLEQMERELKELLAIVHNKKTISSGYKLQPIPGTIR